MADDLVDGLPPVLPLLPDVPDRLLHAGVAGEEVQGLGVSPAGGERVEAGPRPVPQELDGGVGHLAESLAVGGLQLVLPGRPEGLVVAEHGVGDRPGSDVVEGSGRRHRLVHPVDDESFHGRLLRPLLPPGGVCPPQLDGVVEPDRPVLARDGPAGPPHDPGLPVDGPPLPVPGVGPPAVEDVLAQCPGVFDVEGAVMVVVEAADLPPLPVDEQEVIPELLLGLVLLDEVEEVLHLVEGQGVLPHGQADDYLGVDDPAVGLPRLLHDLCRPPVSRGRGGLVLLRHVSVSSGLDLDS
jgi:hypothetical protein